MPEGWQDAQHDEVGRLNAVLKPETGRFGTQDATVRRHGFVLAPESARNTYGYWLHGYSGVAFWIHNWGTQTCHFVQDCSEGEFSLFLERKTAPNTYDDWVLRLPDLTFFRITGYHEKMHDFVGRTSPR